MSSHETRVVWCLTETVAKLVTQTDNGREFYNAANKKELTGKGGTRGDDEDENLNDELLGEVICEISKLWPGTKQVKGRARHSPSNGGVERLNQTLQRRLGGWMAENESKRWSIGCKVVQWGIATDFSNSIQMSPYEYVFGQKHL